jgi:hypothetical protein
LVTGRMVLEGSRDILQVKVEDCFSGLKDYCAHRGPFWISKKVIDFGWKEAVKGEPVSLFEIHMESGTYNDVGHAPKFLLTFSP